MKEGFNLIFDEVFRVKEVEMKRTVDKNVRIKKIIKDLGMDEAVLDPHWTVDEKPARLLEVKDEEIRVEKYISEEEQEKIDALAKDDEGRLVVICINMNNDYYQAAKFF